MGLYCLHMLFLSEWIGSGTQLSAYLKTVEEHNICQSGEITHYSCKTYFQNSLIIYNYMKLINLPTLINNDPLVLETIR